MTFDKIRAALAPGGRGSSDFDLNPDVIPVEQGIKSAAAVLCAIVERNGVPHVILTKRAQHLRHHPGQIAFPGGKVEASDRSLEAAALREAEEEIGLPAAAVEILGQLPAHLTVTGFEVQPVVARVTAPFDVKIDPGEVEEVIYVPLSHLLDRARYSVEGRVFGEKRRNYYTNPFGPYYIWGATARMTLALAERLDGAADQR